MSVFHSLAVGPAPLPVSSVTKNLDICASVWMAGRGPDVKPVHLAVLKIGAAMADDVWNCRLRHHVNALRYINILLYVTLIAFVSIIIFSYR